MRKVSGKEIGLLYVALAASFWGSEAVLAKLCYNVGYNTATLLFVRFFMGSVYFLAFAAIFRQKIALPREKWPIFCRLALVQIGGSVCLFKAFELLTPSLAILFFYLYPSLACLLGIVVYKEKIVWSKIVAIAIAFFGLALLYGSSIGSIYIPGALIALAAAIFQAFNLTTLGRFLPGVSTIAYNTTQNTVMAGIYGLYLLISGDFIFIPTFEGISFILMAGLFAWVIPTNFFTAGIRRVGSTDASIICFLEAPFTVLLSYIVFREILNPVQMLGAVMIISGVVLPQAHALYLRRKLPERDNPYSEKQGAA